MTYRGTEEGTRMEATMAPACSPRTADHQTPYPESATAGTRPAEPCTAHEARHQPTLFPHRDQRRGRSCLVRLPGVLMRSLRGETREACVGADALVRESNRRKRRFSWSERGLMQRMRRIRRSHAEPPHNVPREPLGLGRRLLILRLILPGKPKKAGCYPALGPSTCS